LDYLVKPIDLGELRKAIDRYKVKAKKAPQSENLQLALQNMATKDVSDHQLILQTQEGEMRLVVKDIIRVEGERNYSYIYLKNSKKKLITKTLADLEGLLDDKGFFRCHRSYIINADHIAGTPKSFSLTLSDGMELPVSRRKKEAFGLWFEKYQADKLTKNE
jgi:two-component system LytT family response regulator